LAVHGFKLLHLAPFFLSFLAPHFGRFLLIPIILLAAIGALWRQKRTLDGRDPEQDPAIIGAKYDLRFSLWMWAFLGPPTILFIARPDLIRPIVNVLWEFF
jgi:hypothetical protein